MLDWEEDPSPLQRVQISIAADARVRLYCKRDDLYGPAPGTPLQGNKVRKLEPTLRAALAADHPPLLLSFGGAYSNHVAALATAGKLYDLPTHLIIRGREVDNPVLQYCAAAGADLERISRAEYRRKTSADWLDELRSRVAKVYHRPMRDIWLIPEGGTSPAGARNVGKLYHEVTQALGEAPDYICISAGTGGSAAGIIQAANPATTIEIFPALKGTWMTDEIEKLLPGETLRNWYCVSDYHFGGYGKYPAAWRIASPGLGSRADIGTAGLPPLEPIYTAKLFFGVLDRITRGLYAPGSTIVVVHTGGIY